MYTYNRRRKIGPISILFLVLFACSIVGLGVFSYIDKGRFWDLLPYFCVPIMVLSLILAIFNLARRVSIGFVFIMFFIIFTIGLILSSVFGPFALRREASSSYESKDYSSAISSYETILDIYFNSRHAEEALRNISFAYYYDNRNTEALTNLNKAIDEQIIDPGQLQVKQVLSDIYFKLAEMHAERDEYLLAAKDYLSSVQLLEQIRTGFPDTNEAFIADYKIPHYMYNASESYIEAKNWEDAIRILEVIISDYPESDFYEDAVNALDDSYLELASELGSNSEYEEAISWFTKFLGSNPEVERNYLLDLKIKKVFEDAPPHLIKQSADFQYNNRNYHEAVFLYTLLSEFNPDYQDSITPFLVDSKIHLARSTPYNETLQPKTGRYIEIEGSSLLVFKNITDFSMTAYIRGTGSYLSNIGPGESAEIEILSGEYDLLMVLNTSDLLPFFGQRSYEEKRTYTETIEIEEPAD